MHDMRMVSDQEIVALLVGRRSALRLWERHGGLDRLAQSGYRTLRRDLTPAGASRLCAALELGRRILSRPLATGAPVRGPQDIAAHLGPLVRGETRERMFAFLLDTRHRLIRRVEVAVGTLDSIPVVARDVLVEAVRESAAAVIFAHNHPSGDPTPSPEDRSTTATLRMACSLLGIRMLDHIVVGDPGWTSIPAAPDTLGT